MGQLGKLHRITGGPYSGAEKWHNVSAQPPVANAPVLGPNERAEESPEDFGAVKLQNRNRISMSTMELSTLITLDISKKGSQYLIYHNISMMKVALLQSFHPY